ASGKSARDRQKSYADLKRQPMEFQVGDKVMLKVSLWKGVVRFGKWGELNPRYVGPFKVLERIGDVAYKLDLSEELSRVHNTFHVSNLKKSVPLDGLHVDDKLHFVEELVEIIDREVKWLKQSRIPLVKSGKSNDPPINPNDQPNNSETPVNFDSDDEDKESTPQPKPKDPKPVKETPIPKQYKPKIPYPQRLRKEKMEAQYDFFILKWKKTVKFLLSKGDLSSILSMHIDVIDEILEEDFDALLDEGSKILYQSKVLKRLGSIFTLVYAAVQKPKKAFDFQDSPNDEEDTRSSQEYMNDLEEEYQGRDPLVKFKRFFKKAKYNKVKAKLALLSSSASAPSSSSRKKGLIAESYDWDEKEVSSDDNEVTKVKALMALANEERFSVSKESARNGEWIKISMKKIHTLLEMDDNGDRKYFLDYLCIDLNYVKEQINNLMSKHRNLIQELNTCKEQLLVLKQAKLDLLTMLHVNMKILKENQNLRNELKELTSITEAWLNSSNKVN
nr:putative reverse transcriptase domain-containing protein [Tanacetum cinerariifolium]